MSIFAPSQLTEDPDAATLESMKRANARIYKRGEVTESARMERALTIATRYGRSHNEIAGDVRAYNGAKINLANHNWLGSKGSADAEQQYAMPQLRERARDLEENNPYGERYLAELEANVLGSNGMTLQMQVEEFNPFAEGDIDPKTNKPKQGAWEKDEIANDKIESAWYEWRKKGNCDVSGELSYHDIERLMLRSAARDGHVLCRLVPNWKDNDFRFAIQPIESDALDTSYNTTLPNGNIIVMGVEMDKWRRRVAYHILTRHPGDFLMANSPSEHRRERVPATEIIHLFLRRRIGQTIGVSWFAPVMEQMEMLRGYEEAELISARSEACKGGFFYNDMTGEAGFSGTVTDPTGIRKKMVPGQMDVLPYGWKYQPNNPTHPNGNYSGYRQGVLRGIASGLSCSYPILGNDLSGVSYSSLRGSLLDEREIYKMLQEWFINHFEIPVFHAWLSAVLGTKKLQLPVYKEEKFRKPFFQGRRWPWVDPLKDIQASAMAVKEGFASRRQIVAEGGNYIVDIAKEQAADNALQERYGLSWGEEAAKAEPTKPDEPELDADGKPIPGTEPDDE